MASFCRAVKRQPRATTMPSGTLSSGGEITLAMAAEDLDRIIANIKNDIVLPKMQQNFYSKIKEEAKQQNDIYFNFKPRA